MVGGHREGDSEGGARPVRHVGDGRRGGVQVVVQGAAHRPLGVSRVGCRGHGTGIAAQQIVQLVAARCCLLDEAIGVQRLQVVASLGEGTTGQGGERVAVDAGSGMDPDQCEDPLPLRGEVLVGHGERGPDRTVPGGQMLQPVGVLREQVGQVGHAPGRVAAQPASGQRDGQRQISTRRHHSCHRLSLGFCRGRRLGLWLGGGAAGGERQQ